jgi:hypothetical protein
VAFLALEAGMHRSLPLTGLAYVAGGTLYGRLGGGRRIVGAKPNPYDNGNDR